MKKTVFTLGIIVVMVCAGAQAQTCPKAAADDAALEQLLLLQFAKACGLDDYELVEMLTGHAEFRATMQALTERRISAAVDLQKAIDDGANSSAIASKMNALMALDKQILSAKQGAVSEAGSVLSASDQAALYLLVSELEQRKQQLRAALGASGAPRTMLATAPPAVAAVAAPVVSPKEAILASIKTFAEKLAAKDIDAVVNQFSDSFSHYELGDKEGMRAFLKDAADMGYLDDIEIDLDDAEVEIDGDKGTVYPIDVFGAFGSATLELKGQQEKGAWVLTGLDISGI
ncbi:MAG TPA: hypothetical protein VMZ06_10850 [Candidatus Bathyarchaeia archaeon]|nr:hypothetical protein [Candidatus Bathyarchaeia archaeon]